MSSRFGRAGAARRVGCSVRSHEGFGRRGGPEGPSSLKSDWGQLAGLNSGDWSSFQCCSSSSVPRAGAVTGPLRRWGDRKTDTAERALGAPQPEEEEGGPQLSRSPRPGSR